MILSIFLATAILASPETLSEEKTPCKEETVVVTQSEEADLQTALHRFVVEKDFEGFQTFVQTLDLNAFTNESSKRASLLVVLELFSLVELEDFPEFFSSFLKTYPDFSLSAFKGHEKSIQEYLEGFFADQIEDSREKRPHAGKEELKVLNKQMNALIRVKNLLKSFGEYNALSQDKKETFLLFEKLFSEMRKNSVEGFAEILEKNQADFFLEIEIDGKKVPLWLVALFRFLDPEVQDGEKYIELLLQQNPTVEILEKHMANQKAFEGYSLKEICENDLIRYKDAPEEVKEILALRWRLVEEHFPELFSEEEEFFEEKE